MTHSATAGRRAAKTADGEGEAYWFYGDRAVLRSPEGALPVIIEHHVGPGAAAPLHVHHDVDDSFYLLRGQLAMRCGDDTFVANAGDYVSLPKGVPHALSNVAPRRRCCCRRTTRTRSSRSSGASASPVISRRQIPRRLTTRP